jgi:non-ribosomal peptide synthetase component F
MLSHFKELLNSIVEEPGQKIGELAMLTKEEEQQLLVEFNDNGIEYPKDKNIIDLFEEQVGKTPGARAVVFEDESLSYQELNVRSNQLAHYLRNKGVKAETLVPICLERGMEMIVGILAILKAGGAYVPIDPEYPQERIGYMLEDTQARIIVSTSQSRSKLQSALATWSGPAGEDSPLAVIELDSDRSAIPRSPWAISNQLINLIS